MTKTSPLVKFIIWLVLSSAAGCGMVIMAIYLYLVPNLPDTEALRDIELQTPLRVYASDGLLISEFGEKRRNPISYADTPPLFIQALLASEDDGFFEHSGIDLKGLTRAAIELVRTGKKKSGGSTITMQVAKNYYLSSEKTFTRKFTEILLALKIEQSLSKEEILELYINKIYLGKRAYGIEAAAQVYYGRSIKDLSLAQLAMIAGLPQAPSAANPINSPKRAVDRRNYVLARMRNLDKISEEEFQQALREPDVARYHGPTTEVDAPYIAEMVRQEMVDRFGDQAYTGGYSVYTTVNSKRQTAASKALQQGLINYDREHGYRRSEPEFSLVELTPENDNPLLREWFAAADSRFDIDWPSTLEEWDNYIRQQGDFGLLTPAIVADVRKDGAWTYSDNGFLWLPFSGMTWARPYLSVDSVGQDPKNALEVVSIGQKIWLQKTANGLELGQMPKAEGAIVSLNPNDGGIEALVGGFSFSANKFNRVIQAERQPGSAFKPFIYSAALANGFTPASIINDAPVVFEDASLENTWRPENHNGKFYGPTRLREALYKSQNLVSIRILKQIGTRTAIRYVEPFGFDGKKLNNDLSLALGSSAVTPMELATGYCVLANGGYAVKPYLIQRIEDDQGTRLFTARPAVVCRDCDDTDDTTEAEIMQPAEAPLIATEEPDTFALAPTAIDAFEPTPEPTKAELDDALPIIPAAQVMDPRIHYLMVSMLQDVVRRGTGKRALALNRHDLAGKTGTTNDQKDAWFSGFSPDLVTTTWIGFDQPQTLGRWAFGSNTALPIWVDYMKTALEGVAEHPFEQPPGIVSVRIDPETGELARPGQRNAIFEYFRQEDVPTEVSPSEKNNAPGDYSTNEVIPEQLF
ncbi:MAG: penicillin-binding protein 1A [Thalassolituus sp.]|uniref:penicillin-binding protein 1A n=1 Tax=Thalassolituus TaxID=187492 RepID=UPI001CE33887|nr:penicillin-binding protein 1A [Thalassolituus oleivorans]MCA6126406.1 peptidase [Thalassolituus oleivorans 4BN06-13]